MMPSMKVGKTRQVLVQISMIQYTKLGIMWWTLQYINCRLYLEIVTMGRWQLCLQMESFNLQKGCRNFLVVKIEEIFNFNTFQDTIFPLTLFCICTIYVDCQYDIVRWDYWISCSLAQIFLFQISDTQTIGTICWIMMRNLTMKRWRLI